MYQIRVSRMMAFASVTAVTLTASASGRFEIVDGQLLDHSSGLTWRSLSSTAGTALPLSPAQGEYRVASGEELFAVLPNTFGATSLLGPDSDVYTALSFFVQSYLPAQGCLLLPGSDQTCFSGWWYGGQINGNAAYNVASFVFGPAPGSGVIYSSLSTIGSYTSSFCPLPACNPAVGLFEVRAVPELPAAVSLVAGLAGGAMGSRIRRRREGDA